MNISRTIYSCEHTEYDVTFTPDIVFAHRETGDLKLFVISPVSPDLPREPETFYNPIGEKFKKWHEAHPEAASQMEPRRETRVFPLIVDVPGSGWGGVSGHVHVPHMVDLARRGFVCASISYRGTYRNNVTFPAAVQDTKEAIRFLRAHAAEFHIDPERVGVMGDSSGGNTASMAALTGDEPRYNIGENLDQTTAVRACCNVYGPIDLLNLVNDRVAEHKKLRPGEAEEGLPFESMEIWQETYKEDPEKFLRDASPLYRIEEGMQLPPFLFIQGDDDAIIPMAQGLRFCDRLRECGGRAEFIKIAGGLHGTGCWSHEMIEAIGDFFSVYLK